MTATAGSRLGSPAAMAAEPTPLADYLGSVVRRLRPLPPLDLDLTQAYGNVLAEDVIAPYAYPAFDHAAIDGYAARWDDIATAGRPSRLGAVDGRPVRLNVVGDLAASSWRPVRLTPGTCFSVAAGAPLPATADVVVPIDWTDQGMAAVEVYQAPKRGYGVRRAGDELAAGAVLARRGAAITPALIAVLAATDGTVQIRTDQTLVARYGGQRVEYRIPRAGAVEARVPLVPAGPFRVAPTLTIAGSDRSLGGSQPTIRRVVGVPAALSASATAIAKSAWCLLSSCSACAR